MKSLYSIVIPVYNSSNSVSEIVTRIFSVFDAYSDKQCEVILVNDCSEDPETKKVLTLLSNDPRVISITLTKNYGQQPATLCGIKYSSGEYIITMDDDLQHSPEDIGLLISKECHDIVIGCFAKKKHNILKNTLSGIKSYFDYILIGKPKSISMSSFRLFSRLIADEVLKIKTPNPFIPAQLFIVSRDVVNVEVTHSRRAYGVSSYGISKMLSLFSNLVINNSSLLLTLLGRIGVTSFFLSVIMIFYIVFKKLYLGVDISGWSSLMSAILLMGGLLLLGVGVIGEYLIRIIGNGESMPCYVVRKVERND